jgi:hypothetical protein
VLFKKSAPKTRTPIEVKTFPTTIKEISKLAKKKMGNISRRGGGGGKGPNKGIKTS